jgi:hypothetical protein
VVIGNDNLVYVCDRQSDRIQVFDKMGHFKNNIWIKRGNSLPDNWGTTWWIGFSPDREQKYMYVDDGGDEQVKILEWWSSGLEMTVVGAVEGILTYLIGIAIGRLAGSDG